MEDSIFESLGDEVSPSVLAELGEECVYCGEPLGDGSVLVVGAVMHAECGDRFRREYEELDVEAASAYA